MFVHNLQCIHISLPVVSRKPPPESRIMSENKAYVLLIFISFEKEENSVSSFMRQHEGYSRRVLGIIGPDIR